MYIEISLLAFVVVFSILVYFLVRALFSVQQTLRRANDLMLELERNLKQMESTFKSISNVGDICEDKTSRLRREYLEKKEIQEQENDGSVDLAEWLIASIKLSSKYFRRS